MKYYVYVLKSLKDNSLYKGHTNNLERRVLQHNNGQCKSTRAKRPLELVYYDEFNSREEARERKKYILNRVLAEMNLKRYYKLS